MVLAAWRLNLGQPGSRDHVACGRQVARHTPQASSSQPARKARPPGGMIAFDQRRPDSAGT